MDYRQPGLRRFVSGLAPVVFGPLGVIAGFVAGWKGQVVGNVGRLSQLVAAVASAYLLAWLST